MIVSFRHFVSLAAVNDTTLSNTRYNNSVFVIFGTFTAQTLFTIYSTNCSPNIVRKPIFERKWF